MTLCFFVCVLVSHCFIASSCELALLSKLIQSEPFRHAMKKFTDHLVFTFFMKCAVALIRASEFPPRFGDFSRMLFVVKFLILFK